MTPHRRPSPFATPVFQLRKMPEDFLSFFKVQGIKNTVNKVV